MPVAMTAYTVITEVKGCARCGEDHKVVVRPFINTPDVVDGKTGRTVTHYAICPVTLEPILAAVMDRTDLLESVA